MRVSLPTVASLLIFVALSISLPGQQDASALAKAEAQAAVQQSIQDRFKDIYREKIQRRQPIENKAGSDNTLEGPADYEMLVSGESGAESEIHAAVNPSDDNNIVISPIRSEGVGGISMPVYYSRDHGQSWQRSDLRAGGGGGGDPMFAFDAEGTLYFSWIATGAGQSISLLFATSHDGGATFGPIDTIFSGSLRFRPPATFTGRMADKQWMAVDRSSSAYRGSLYTIFLELSSDPDDPAANYRGIYVRRKPAGSPSFVRESVQVSGNDFFDMQFAGIDVDLDGRVHAFFWGSREAGASADYFLWHAHSDDGGASFSQPRSIAPVRFPPETQNVSIPSFLPQRLHSSPQFAVDNHPLSPFRGHLYAVWSANDISSNLPPSMDEPFHVYFSASSDGGESWSSPQRVNDDVVDYRADHFLPSVAVSPNGSVLLTWYDGRAAANNVDVDFYMALSQDGGATLSANRRVSSAGMNINSNIVGFFGIGDYNKSVATSRYAVPVWSDGRDNNGNLNVYAAFIPLGSSVDVKRSVSITANAELQEVIPNPLQNDGIIRYRLGRAGHVLLDIVDANGRHCLTLEDSMREAGVHSRDVSLQQLAPGTYFCRLQTGGATLTQQLLIQR